MKNDEKILWFSGNTSLDIPAKRVLKTAKEHGLRDVIVIGNDMEGDFYFAGSPGDAREVLWMLARAQKSLMEMMLD